MKGLLEAAEQQVTFYEFNKYLESHLKKGRIWEAY